MHVLLTVRLIFFLHLIRVIHPFHVSVCEIEYNDNTQKFEISIRIFTDDFENALKSLYPAGIDLNRDYNKENVRNLIEAYLEKHFSIWINGEQVDLKYLGSEPVEDATWNYLESAEIPWNASMALKNEVLFDVFGDQMNLVHVSKGGGKKSFRFDRDHHYIEL